MKPGYLVKKLRKIRQLKNLSKNMTTYMIDTNTSRSILRKKEENIYLYMKKNLINIDYTELKKIRCKIKLMFGMIENTCPSNEKICIDTKLGTFAPNDMLFSMSMIF